jgi:peptidoglycan/xylan/chitin deacetylase (PgdA/CDA1 family)
VSPSSTPSTQAGGAVPRPTTRPTAPRRSVRPTAAPRDTPTRGGTVYLTFDDGPSIYTPQILQILAATHSSATFFQLGSRRALLPAIAQQVTAQGSTVGNHTYDHKDLTKLSGPELAAEIRGGPPSRCVRPPYGATNATVAEAIRRAGARQLLWTVDTLDWTLPGVPSIERAATATTLRSGSIVLLHDGGGDRSQTVAALPGIILNLQHRGFVVRHLPHC